MIQKYEWPAMPVVKNLFRITMDKLLSRVLGHCYMLVKLFFNCEAASKSHESFLKNQNIKCLYVKSGTKLGRNY